MNTIYVGIDQSFTSTGLVIKDHNGFFTHKIITTKPEEKTQLEKVRRANYICTEIVNTIINENYNNFHVVVNIEGIGFGARGDATRDLGGLQFMIIDFLQTAGINDIRIIAPTSLKKFGTGKGNAKKDEMLESVPEPHKSEFIRSYKKSKGRFDIVDAYWLANFEKDLN